LAPPIIRHLAHPDLADCVHHVLALRDQNIDLPQLRDDLFRLVSLPCHCSPPGCQRHTSSRTTSMGGNHLETLHFGAQYCRRALSLEDGGEWGDANERTSDEARRRRERFETADGGRNPGHGNGSRSRG